MGGIDTPRPSDAETNKNVQSEVALIENELGLYLEETLGINGEYANKFTQVLLKSSQNQLSDGDIDEVAMHYLKKYVEEKTGNPLPDYMDGGRYAEYVNDYVKLLTETDPIVKAQVERYDAWCRIYNDSRINRENFIPQFKVPNLKYPEVKVLIPEYPRKTD